jgi:hypothetical protein
MGAVTLLAVMVAALALTAYERSRPQAPTGLMAPAPTFTLGVSTPTPTPTPETFPAEQQRMLAIGSQQWWRATAGVCGGPPPVIERSSDAGVTWVNVTPNYLGIERVQTLDAFTDSDAEVIAAAAGCNAQALRTYTGGEFWESYPDVLARSRYVDTRDAATIVLPTGPVPATCAAPSGLRAEGDVVALLCDGLAWFWSGTAWQQIGPEDAVALAIDGDEVIVAHAYDGCGGVAVSRAATAEPKAPTALGCVEGFDVAAPLAIDLAGRTVVAWSGDVLVNVP